MVDKFRALTFDLGDPSDTPTSGYTSAHTTRGPIALSGTPTHRLRGS